MTNPYFIFKWFLGHFSSVYFGFSFHFLQSIYHEKSHEQEEKNWAVPRVSVRFSKSFFFSCFVLFCFLLDFLEILFIKFSEWLFSRKFISEKLSCTSFNKTGLKPTFHWIVHLLILPKLLLMSEELTQTL